MRRSYFLFFLCLWFTGTFAQQKIKILFVGNSLTYSNNLPELVKTIAACDSVSVQYKMMALPNYALIDHWNDGYVIRELKTGGYDYAVVQQGPSSQEEGRTMLIRDGALLAELCAANNTRLSFFMVWPSKIRSGDFPAVMESYRLAAEKSNSMLCPAGKAWQQVWKAYPEFSLYSADNFHPEYKGSLLAAMVIYGSLMKKTSFNFVDYLSVKNQTLSKQDFKILQQAAKETLKK